MGSKELFLSLLGDHPILSRHHGCPFHFYLFLAALGLCCCTQASSSCSAQFPHYSGFSRQGSVILVHWLSCPAACGMFPKQTRDLICVPCIGRWICDHWTTEHTSEFPGVVSFTWGRRGACVFSSLL